MARLDDREREIGRLQREHTKLDEQLQVLEARKWLSATDEAEVRRLKREKLVRKDRLRALQLEA